jgi:hypothetical protein
MSEFPVDVLTFNERGGDPGATASSGKYYTKDVGGITRWFYQDSAGVVSQLAAGLVPSTNSVDYRHQTSLLVKGTATNILASTSFQSVFAPGNDTITLPANTTYKVRGLYAYQNAAAMGLISLGFSGGTIGVGAPGDALINMTVIAGQQNATAPAGSSERPIMFLNSLANEWIVLSAGTTFSWLHLTGKIRTVSGGTFVPQIKTSVATAAPNLMRMSYLELIPVGGATFESVGQGGWA